MPLPLRFGPGPVFVYESIAASRRWQLYALRSLFVTSLLAALALIWLFTCAEEGKLVQSRCKTWRRVANTFTTQSRRRSSS
jgi:hypothetical protein